MDARNCSALRLPLVSTIGSVVDHFVDDRRCVVHHRVREVTPRYVVRSHVERNNSEYAKLLRDVSFGRTLNGTTQDSCNSHARRSACSCFGVVSPPGVVSTPLLSNHPSTQHRTLNFLSNFGTDHVHSSKLFSLKN